MLIARIKEQVSSLKHRHDLRKIIFNTGWLFSDRVLRMAASLVVGAWVARYLGTQQFGLLNYATAWVGLFAPIANVGVDNLVVRDLVAEPSKRYEILGTTFILKLVSTVITVLLTIGSIFWLNYDEPLTISLVAILSICGFFRATDTIDLWFQSQVASKNTVIAKNSAFLAITIVKIIAVTVKAPLIAFAWMTVLEVGLSAISLCLVYLKKQGAWQLWQWNPKLAKNLLKEGLPLILSALSITIYMKIDAIMLKQMIDDGAVGLYSAAVKISEVGYFIPVTIASSVSPAIYAAKAASETLYYQRIQKLMRLLVWVAIAIAIPMTFVSQTIINILFGNDYQGAGIILAIHIWASVFVFIGVASQPWFLTEKLTNLTFYRTVLGAVINIILNILLIPKYAGVGAAIATVIAYGVSSILANATLAATRPIFKMQIKSLLFWL